jgi:hypothetical protein
LTFPSGPDLFFALDTCLGRNFSQRNRGAEGSAGKSDKGVPLTDEAKMGDSNIDMNETQNGLHYDQWKKHSLLLYDTLINQKMIHPSPCVRWGRVISEDQHNTVQRYGTHTMPCLLHAKSTQLEPLFPPPQML